MSVGSYVIRGGTAGRERLRLLSRILRPQTLDLFRKAGLAEGVNCLDIGCGGGDASFEMARIVGPSGLVLGIDLDDEKLALARAEAAELGLSNVEFRHADAMDPSAGRERFGFVFARQLLCHVADPAGVIRQMLDHAAPGGILAIEDIDFRGHFCWPPCPELEDYIGLVREIMRRRGANPDIGPALPILLLDAGLRDVEMRVAQVAAMRGEAKLIHAITMKSVTEAVVAEGLATPNELMRIADALFAFAEDPTTVMSLPRYIQSWGRKQ